MKINQVEELVGITKKNIRYYEDEGLIKPDRNPDNGYREYSLKDVEVLNRIKLFRKLSVPIEDIKKLFDGETSFDECINRHMITLKNEQHNLEIVRELCMKLSKEVDDIESLDVERYLDMMQHMEVEGTHFMDIEKKDVHSKKYGPTIAAVVFIALSVATIGVLFWANAEDPIPTSVFIFILLPIVAIIVGIVVALRMRLKEINGGEEDEASKY